jgi:hypothetical protein
MADLRPLGSEKLQGMDKLKRIMEIATYKETPKTNINESQNDYTVQLADGLTYSIVKEKNGYVLKKGLNESSLDYVDSMKGRKYYRSYSDAMKRLNLTAGEMNRLYGNEEGIALIGEQAQKKKFVLKVKKGNKTPDVGGDDMSTPTPPVPPMDEPTPAPPVDTTTPPPPMDEPTDMGTETPTPPTGEDQPSDEMEPSGDDFDLGGDDKEGNQDQQGPSFKSIQRLVGKLSQRIRVIEKEKGMESDDMKYVLNSILSAMDLDKLDEDDREDILSNFDEDESEYGAEGPGDLDFSDEEDFDLGDEETTEPIEPPMEKEPKENYMGIYSESVVENVLSKYFVISENEKPLLEEKRKRDYINEMSKKVKVKSEIRKLSESLQQFESSLKLFNEGANFAGKTNKENLVFIKNGKQIKVDQRGRII